MPERLKSSPPIRCAHERNLNPDLDMAVNVSRILSDLRRELQLVEEAIAGLERVTCSQARRRGSLPKSGKWFRLRAGLDHRRVRHRGYL